MKFLIRYSILLLLYILPFSLYSNEQLSAICISCHSSQQSSYIPNINGQPEQYLKRALLNFRANIVPNTMMTRIANRLSNEDISWLSKYFSSKSISFSFDREINDHPGLDIYNQKCAACHQLSSAGIPILTGLPKEYLGDAIDLFKQGRRIMPASMGYYISNMSEQETKLVIDYLSGFKVVPNGN
ncbi:c-type cytochrome [Pseudoalteromonas sp. S16_S37]|uniref:c-type cytochrome n=1 Tax=Pseudoalteromonas sp. S16_S37 TaxID=2720228 RepID=UPI0016812765|nr:c-type cytochrome [Pseudoalteromonas sp. S16_S37]MBD1583321.1 cytochrome c [Pseudoalteromonas sp. S16_S37]